jgi:hypothetical protein
MISAADLTENPERLFGLFYITGLSCDWRSLSDAAAKPHSTSANYDRDLAGVQFRTTP